MTVSEIVALNPSLLRLLTPQDTSFDLHLPPGTKQVYTDRLKEIPADHRASWRFHVVRQGETLDSVAATLHAHTDEIAEVNGFATGSDIEAGDELVIPVATASVVSRPQHYVPRRGETLTAIADRFNTTVTDLRRWNHLSSNAVRPGRSLNVSEPIRFAPAAYAVGRSRRSSRLLPMHVRSRASSRTASRTRSSIFAPRASTRRSPVPAAARARAASSRRTAAR